MNAINTRRYTLSTLVLFVLFALGSAILGLVVPHTTSTDLIVDTPEIRERRALIEKGTLTEEEYRRLDELSETTLRQIERAVAQQGFPLFDYRRATVVFVAVPWLILGMIRRHLTFKIATFALIPLVFLWAVGWMIWLEVLAYPCALYIGIGIRRAFNRRSGAPSVRTV